MTGDATGSVFRDITTDAGDFVRGDSADSAFEIVVLTHDGKMRVVAPGETVSGGDWKPPEWTW